MATKKKDDEKDNGEKDEGKKGEEGKEKDEGQKSQPTPEEKIANLEQQLGKMGKEWDEAKGYISGSAVVINTIASNPELRDHFQKVLQGENVVAGKPPTGEQSSEGDQKKTPPAQPSDETKRTVDDVATSQRDSVVRSFEQKWGISKMKDEERLEARRKIEGHFNKWGQSVKNAPLAVLADQLDSAFVATHAEKLREEGKLEGITQTRASQQGEMPTISGGGVPPEGGGGLTPGQKGWAEKIPGASVEGATKAIKERDNEQTRVPPAEQKKAD